MIAEPLPVQVALVQTADGPTGAERAAPPQTIPDPTAAPTARGPDWSIRIGAGALVLPDFVGAKTYRIAPLPSIDIGYKGLVTANVAEGLNVALLRSAHFRAGPTLRYRFGQYERDAPQGLHGLGDVSGAVEAGASFTWERSGLGIRGYAGWDLGTGHKGGVAELSAFAAKRVQLSFQRTLFARVGPRVTFGTARYFQSYFGVDARQALASGLTPYRPNGGLERIGLDGSVTVPIDRRWAFTLLAGASVLMDEAADSPRVAARGSRRQGILGTFLTYAL